jgi:hypothetical protein
VVTASPAAALCGTACDDWDPYHRIYTGPYDWYTCADDAVTVQSTSISSGAVVELRRSVRCGTAWARTRSAYYIKVERDSPNLIHDALGPGAVDTYTKMVYDASTRRSRACIYAPYGDWHCTPWV